jgi:hypothetical protein
MFIAAFHACAFSKKGTGVLYVSCTPLEEQTTHHPWTLLPPLPQSPLKAVNMHAGRTIDPVQSIRKHKSIVFSRLSLTGRTRCITVNSGGWLRRAATCVGGTQADRRRATATSSAQRAAQVTVSTKTGWRSATDTKQRPEPWRRSQWLQAHTWRCKSAGLFPGANGIGTAAAPAA